MRGGWLIAACFALGCASAPAPRAVIAIPERCVCPTTPTDCDHGVASVRADDPKSLSAEQLNTMYRAKAIADAATTTDYWLDNVGVDDTGASVLAKVDASVLENEAGLAAVAPEQDLLRGMHDLRDALAKDDAMPPAERKILTWNTFDSEVARFREATARALSERIADVLLRHAAIAGLVTNVASYMPKELATPGRDFAEQRARVMLANTAMPTSNKLTDDVIAKRKGQWIAVLHSKS